MEYLILALGFALYFGYLGLVSITGNNPNRAVIIAVYCFAAAIFLLWYAGFFSGHPLLGHP